MGSMTRHIGDGVLRVYALGRLTDAEVASVKEHLLVCNRCQARLAWWGEYLRLLVALLTLSAI